MNKIRKLRGGNPVSFLDCYYIDDKGGRAKIRDHFEHTFEILFKSLTPIKYARLYRNSRMEQLDHSSLFGMNAKIEVLDKNGDIWLEPTSDNQIEEDFESFQDIEDHYLEYCTSISQHTYSYITNFPVSYNEQIDNEKSKYLYQLAKKELYDKFVSFLQEYKNGYKVQKIFVSQNKPDKYDAFLFIHQTYVVYIRFEYRLYKRQYSVRIDVNILYKSTLNLKYLIDAYVLENNWSQVYDIEFDIVQKSISLSQKRSQSSTHISQLNKDLVSVIFDQALKSRKMYDNEEIKALMTEFYRR